MPLYQIIVDVFKAIGEHIRYDLFPYLTTSVWMVPVLAVLALLVWRLWTFTIAPLLYPDSPKIYPYWVPGTLTTRFVYREVRSADTRHYSLGYSNLLDNGGPPTDEV